MRNTELTSWLAGFLLICDPQELSELQRKCILNHARLCEYTEKGRLTVTNFMIRNSLASVSLSDLKKHVYVQFSTVPSPSSEELCYFMQGVFEIDGKVHWTREDAELTVGLLDKNVWGLVPALVNLYYKLTDFLDGEGDMFDMTHVRQQLEQVFIHDIDKSYDYDADVADALHQG